MVVCTGLFVCLYWLGCLFWLVWYDGIALFGWLFLLFVITGVSVWVLVVSLFVCVLG